jgi:hypothetical protein
MGIRVVLLHNVDEAVPGDFSSQKTHNLGPFGLETGHYQVPHQHTTLGNPVDGKTEIPDLGVHGLYGFPCGSSIVVGLEETTGGGRIPEFKVGEVNVHKPV